MEGGESYDLTWPLYSPRGSREVANEELADLHLGDGLPIVIPTVTSFEAMLSTVPKEDWDTVRGYVPPMEGALTSTKVAYCTLLAGGTPALVPVVVTAVEAMIDPRFNLLGVQTTTSSTTTAIVVHGPIVRKLGLSGEGNCLGTGIGSNLVLGRAVRLSLQNIGGCHPQITDMATIGQPAKVGMCFAECETSPFDPYHVREGFGSEQDAVTVIAASGCLEVVPRRTDPEQFCELLASTARLPGNVTSTEQLYGGGEQYFIIPPELALELAEHGWDAQRLCAEIYRVDQEHEPPPVKRAEILVDTGATTRIANHAAAIKVFVAGGVGRKMLFLQSWCGGSQSITKLLPIT